jgi:hypothetical protein
MLVNFIDKIKHLFFHLMEIMMMVKLKKIYFLKYLFSIIQNQYHHLNNIKHRNLLILNHGFFVVIFYLNMNVNILMKMIKHIQGNEFS